MFFKTLIFAALLACINCRYILIDEDYLPELLEHSRVRRQVQVGAGLDNKGNWDLAGKVPLAKSDTNILSATGMATMDPSNKLTSYGAGVALDNINGHGLSLSGRQIPDFGKQLTAAAKLNVVNTPNHNLDANAFVTKNMPSIPNVPNFNTYGAGVDYMYKNKLGASLGAARTDFLQKTDVSAMGKLNLFKTPSSSFDFGAGATRSFSPFIPKSSWEPAFNFNFMKSF
ncbi:attacin-E-like [Pieris brassicae]|uniref:Attacin C-terminal domain-containing protein n=1 Tax=Pieris brassicae TaxID=7116 RepID=A0A9P0TVN6_PIEBR|nr:attacin-E-like [Pieris brassicae]CAH4036408.1 unnamed protein product [Pieris brassicae]